jgi:uncharacterized protein (TIGR02996 family)
MRSSDAEREISWFDSSRTAQAAACSYDPTMPSQEALLEACWMSPDDDAPRLVWADAVGGERGELVVIQCDLARGDLAPRAAAARRRRERALLRRHGREWSGLDAYQPRGSASRSEFRSELRSEFRVEFRRGFVEAAELDPRVFVEHGDDIFRRAPLLRSLSTVGLLVTSGDPLEPLRRLLDTAAFWRLHGLDLRHVGVQTPAFDYDPGFDGHGDEALRLLVAAGAIPCLDGLGVSWSGLSNGIVDAADYVIWRKGGPLANDTAPAGAGPEDYTKWVEQFGSTSPGGGGVGGGAVPEPTSGLLALFAFGAFAGLAKRR